MHCDSPMGWWEDGVCGVPTLTLDSLWKGPPVGLELQEALFGKCHLHVKQTMPARASFFQSTDPRDAE